MAGRKSLSVKKRGSPAEKLEPPPSSSPIPDPLPTQLTGAPPTLLLPLNVVFNLLLVSHTLSALYAPIQDCDETFNYWEPLHFLNHGYGLQTWEYSPEYSIRSWAYILIHAIPTKIISFLGRPKTFEFYALRSILGLACAATETRLYSALSRTLHAKIGVFYIMVVAFTPGFFYASTAFLPSSFAMITTNLGVAAFVDWRGGARTAIAITWFAVGALLGWPFAGALIIPFVVEEWAGAILSNKIVGTFGRYLAGALRCLVPVIWQFGIDSALYRKPVFVPWRIVSYNVFAGKDRGPDIFGTEPWHFYVRNLALNFNLWFLLAMSAAPMLLLQALFFKHQTSPQMLVRTVALISPFYLWFAIFTLQPHKEERFMFPAYPCIALNAAIAFHMLLIWIGNADPRTLIGKVPAKLKLAVILPVVLLSLEISLLRILGTITAYGAPLHIYQPLEELLTSPNDTVCIAKEWYRFPSSFFLPNDIHLKFVKSEFDGLLPGEFYEDRSGWTGELPGAWMIPEGMNDRNEEDIGKYTSIDRCTYLVDSTLPSVRPSTLEPAYAETGDWERVKCERFLDSGSTNIVGRTIWLPDLGFIPARLRRVWGEHCLLRRRLSR